jgi:predicted esterase YcpF (UPF0227 family)
LIAYLHGFNSSPQSHKAKLLKAEMEARGLGHLYACPALPPLAADAMREIEKLALGPADCLVGSSLGGFYATWLAENLGCRAVLINPAITPHVGLEAYLGEQKNLHTGEPYRLTRAHLEGWRSLCLDRIEPERYLLLVETGDEVLDWREAARKYEGARMVIRQGGDHSLQSFPEHLGRILAFAGLAR